MHYVFVENEGHKSIKSVDGIRVEEETSTDLTTAAITSPSLYIMMTLGEWFLRHRTFELRYVEKRNVICVC